MARDWIRNGRCFYLGWGADVIIRSPVDGRLFLAYPQDPNALSQSFDKLHLFDDGGADLVSVRCDFFAMSNDTQCDIAKLYKKKSGHAGSLSFPAAV